MAYFEDLTVWQESRKLTLAIYNMMSECKDFGFRDQIQRASVSIMNNIAEGSESGSNALFVKFLRISKGSCAELRSMLYLCKDMRYCSEDMGEQLLNCTLFISRSLNKLILSIQQRQDDNI